jgi:hypothetical protein
MALHRDIYWVGKQWAVTGYGIQACNQKQRGKFDIEAARLWEDGVLEDMRAQKWLNNDDFDQAISAARKHYPEPPRKARPVAAAPPPPPPPRKVLAVKKEETRNPPVVVPLDFMMRFEGCRARLMPTWRVQIRWKN